MTTAILFDKSDEKPEPDLSDAWWLGAVVYQATRRADHVLGARSAAEAVNWLEELGPVDELQFWGHGRPGAFFIGREKMVPQRFARAQVRRLLWLRTCASFAGTEGQQLAMKLASELGCTVAGHTFNIGVLHSGLRTLAPSTLPRWSKTEGLDRRGRPLGSAPWNPRTITCLHTSIPRGW